VAPPTFDDLTRAASALGITVPEATLRQLEPFITGFVMAGAPVIDGQDAAPADGRDPGWAPDARENPLGAWYWRCSVRETTTGLLAGRTVALKDNISLAGIPMMNGTDALRGYIADQDATVATRILAAGGEIAGKAVCENLCLSAGSHTAATGPVRNPHDPSRTSGGSSSGCGALVAAGEVDLAVGGDQGGSIRIPASHCGIVGHKPTHGLVPYTGAMSLDPGIDHLGPMGRTVADVALLLDVLAGDDGFDPRQRRLPPVDHRAALVGDVAGLRIGVLTEGFGHASSDPRVDALVRDVADRFGALGGVVSGVSVPAHRSAGGLSAAILSQGLALGSFAASALGGLGRGRYTPSLTEAWGSALPTAQLPPTAVLFAIVGRLLLDADHGATYGRAYNAVPAVIAAYHDAFDAVDLLVMPTTGFIAPFLPPDDADVATSLTAAFSAGSNAAIFDVTGHPAVSVPCGSVDGMPVGMMIVGRHFEDAAVLRAAHALEQQS
jgi:amidase